MTRILLTGSDGQVGWELRRALSPIGDVIACGRRELDLANLRSLRETVKRLSPDVVVNAAAYTGVDKAESEEELAHVVNGEGPRVLAEESVRIGALLVHYSTDYVFDGTKIDPYLENDSPNPINAYGRTKLAGEKAITEVGGDHLIFRTSWVYASRGNNFLRTMLRLGETREELRVVSDQRGGPTWARSIAEATALALIQVRAKHLEPSAVSGIYHLTCAGQATWYEFAQAIFQERGDNPRVVRINPVSTAEYASAVRRPANSLMECDKLAKAFAIRLPCWRRVLSFCMQSM